MNSQGGIMNGEVSEWLETALKYADMKGKNVFGFRIVVEVEPNKVNQVKRELRKMGFTVVGDVMGFITVDIKEPGDLDRVAKIPGVKYVSYEKKFAPMALGLDELVKRVNVMTDPLLNKLNKNKLEKLGYTFKPSTELPKPFNALVDNVKFLESVAKNPAAISEYVKFAGPAGLPVMARADWKLVTYTRELMEAPRDNRLSNRTYVAVIDSGVRYGPGLGSPAEIQSIPMTLYPEPPVDCMSHGCLKNVGVYTSLYGMTNIEEVWDSVESEPIKVKDGEYKPFDEPVYTIGMNGEVEVKGVFRTKSDKKVSIDTPLGTIESTPWHIFYVINPKKSQKPNDSHRRWNAGYEIIEKRADEIEPSGNNLKGDWLLFKPYSGESWSVGLDPKLAYLGGLCVGDGTIIYKGTNLKTGRFYTKENKYEIRVYDEDYAFLNKVKEIYGGKIRKTGENCYALEIYNKELIEKLIPYLQPPINDLEAFRTWIAGFFDAEGNVYKRDDRPSGYARIINTDKQLLEKLIKILNAIGIPALMNSGGVSKGSKTYHIRLVVPQLFYKLVEPYCIKKKDRLKNCNRLSTRGEKVKYLGDYIAVPVKDVKHVDCNEPEYFYDLADSSSHNYLANGFVVHNSWCTACAFGKPAWTRFGYFNPVANAPKCLHVKVFTGMGGCSGFQIMKAMEIAAKKGAKVVSMSLGGALTESIENDPECKLLDQLTKQYGTRFIVAAGNDGPTGWTIGSPGAALEALTVAAFDWKTLGVSSYSSRGPQGQYYKDRKDIFEEHYAKYGDKFIKPDVGGIGGDRNTQVVSACSFWYDGVYDMFPDGWDLMIGTSMATPHVAGLTALLVDRGLVDGVDSIKERMKAIGGQKGIDRGWGLMKYSYFK